MINWLNQHVILLNVHARKEPNTEPEPDNGNGIIQWNLSGAKSADKAQRGQRIWNASTRRFELGSRLCFFYYNRGNCLFFCMSLASCQLCCFLCVCIWSRVCGCDNWNLNNRFSHKFDTHTRPEYNTHPSDALKLAWRARKKPQQKRNTLQKSELRKPDRQWCDEQSSTDPTAPFVCNPL